MYYVIILKCFEIILKGWRWSSANSLIETLTIIDLTLAMGLDSMGGRSATQGGPTGGLWGNSPDFAV